MTMQFCEKCKNLLLPQTQNNKHYLYCKTCDTLTPTSTPQQIIEIQTIHNKKTTIDITPQQTNGHDFLCKKCGHNKAKLTDLGCMIGDEDWIYLLECTKCGWGTRIGNWC
jgi:DNA-directed RNA polymerase subunit M/transcription elongation factor TFIIS